MFVHLPLDIHRYIALLIPTYVPALSGTCWTLYRNLSSVYNSSTQMPTYIEVDRYVNRQRLPLLSIYQEATTEVIITRVTLIDKMYYGNGLRIHLSSHNTVSQVGMEWLGNFINPRHAIIDLQTLKLVIEQRKGCLQRDPLYVRKMVSRYLDDMYRQKRHGSQQDLARLYLYLFMNVNKSRLNFATNLAVNVSDDLTLDTDGLYIKLLHQLNGTQPGADTIPYCITIKDRNYWLPSSEYFDGALMYLYVKSLDNDSSICDQVKIAGILGDVVTEKEIDTHIERIVSCTEGTAYTLEGPRGYFDVYTNDTGSFEIGLKLMSIWLS